MVCYINMRGSSIRTIIPFSLLLALCFFPYVASAAGVGFVPLSGVWFSAASIAPKETVRVYTVVVNNDYASIDGTIGFYANGKSIGMAEINSVSHEHALEVSADWKPDEGSYTLSARFIKLIATTDAGDKVELNVAEMNNTAGSSLTVGGRSPVLSSGGVDAATGASAMIDVKKEGQKFVISIAEGGTGSLAQAAKIPSAGQTSSKPQSAGGLTDHAVMFEKNREAVAKAAASAVAMIDTAKATSPIETKTTSTFLDRGKAYYAEAGTLLEKSKPYANRAWELWLFISDHNDPKRIGIIIIVLIICRYGVRFWWRRRREKKW